MTVEESPSTTLPPNLLSEKPAGKSTPMVVGDVGGLLKLVNRQTNPLQFERELVMNIIQAGATRGWVTPDWVSIGQQGVYRLGFLDDGRGMSRSELLSRCKTLVAKDRGADNYGIGGRTSSLHVSPCGVDYFSIQGGQGFMVRLFVDEAGNALIWSWDDGEGGLTEILPIPDAYRDMMGKFGVVDHGTLVVLHGKSPKDNTFFTADGTDGGSRMHTKILNQRFADLAVSAPGFKLLAYECNVVNYPELWPRSYEGHGKMVQVPSGKMKRTGEYRRVPGFFDYVKPFTLDSGVQRIELQIKDVPWPVNVHWWLLTPRPTKKTVQQLETEEDVFDEEEDEAEAAEVEAPRRQRTSSPHPFVGNIWAGVSGYILNNEIYRLSFTGRDLKKFGLYIPKTELHRRVMIFLEPGEECIPHTDLSRSILEFRWQDNKRDPPEAEWGKLFNDAMPAPLRDLRASIIASMDNAASEDVAAIVAREMRDLGVIWKTAIVPGQRGGAQAGRGEGGGGGGGGSGGDLGKTMWKPKYQWDHNVAEDLVCFAAEYDPLTEILTINGKYPVYEKFAILAVERGVAEGYPEEVCQEAAKQAYEATLIVPIIGNRVVHQGNKLLDRGSYDNLFSKEALTAVADSWIALKDRFLHLLKQPQNIARRRRT